jgi:hypothetical protein
MYNKDNLIGTVFQMVDGSVWYRATWFEKDGTVVRLKPCRSEDTHEGWLYNVHKVLCKLNAGHYRSLIAPAPMKPTVNNNYNLV